MMKVYDNKYSKLLSLIFSSLAFAVLHLFYGFDFMMLAGGLSLILGILYYYDNNIWGVSIVHYVLGTIAFVLKIV